MRERYSQDFCPVAYLDTRLERDTTPDAMVNSQKAEVKKDIPEMCVEATRPRKPPQVIH